MEKENKKPIIQNNQKEKMPEDDGNLWLNNIIEVADKREKIITEFDFSKKKSVRTTFKLTERAIEEIEWLAKYFQITKKEVFDVVLSQPMLHLFLEERSDRHTSKEGDDSSTKEISKAVTRSFVRKTFVVSKGALKGFSELAHEFKIPRDTFIELSILFTKKTIEDILQEQRNNYVKALDAISELEDYAMASEKKFQKIFTPKFLVLSEDEDPIHTALRSLLWIIDDLKQGIEIFLEDGTIPEYDWIRFG